MKEYAEAVKWMTRIFEVDIQRMVTDGIMKKSEVLRTYRHAKERGFTS